MHCHSFSFDEKQLVVEVGVIELMVYVSAMKNTMANELISEALSFVKGYGEWESWLCCACDDRFVDSEIGFRHVETVHLNKLCRDYPVGLALAPVVDENSLWHSIIINGTWKPIDTSAATPILIEKYPLMCSGYKEARKSESESLIGKSTGTCSIPAICPERKIRKMLAREYMLSQTWPISDDTSRLRMLIKVHNMLLVLLMNKSLSESLLNAVIAYAKSELKCIFLNIDIDILPLLLSETHLRLCFLGASQLEKIYIALNEIYQFVLKKISSTKNNTTNATANRIFGPEIKAKVSLDGNSLQIFLSEQSLGGSNFSQKNDVRTDQAQPDSDAMSRWTCTSLPSTEEIESFAHQRKEKKKHGMKLLQALKENHNKLEVLLEEKGKKIYYNMDLHSVWGSYPDEIRKRGLQTTCGPLKFDVFLEMLERDFAQFQLEKKYDALRKGSKLMAAYDVRDEIRSGSILMAAYDAEEIQSLEDYDKREEKREAYFTTGIFSSVMCSNKYSKFPKQVDSFVETAFKRLFENKKLEILKCDVQIVQTINEMQDLEFEMKQVLAFDYQEAALCLVKSYIQANIEELEEQGAPHAENANLMRGNNLRSMVEKSK